MGRPRLNRTHCTKGHEYTPENTLIVQGWRKFCRTCARLRAQEVRSTPEGRSKNNEYQKSWYTNNRKKIWVLPQEKICTTCRCSKPLSDFVNGKRYRDGKGAVCLSCNNAKSREYYKGHKEKVLKSKKVWAEKHPENELIRGRQWKKSNPDKVRANTKRRNGTPKGKLNNAISRGINNSIVKGTKARRHWEELVDFTVDQLREHLEKLFTLEMTWENYGTIWEIDHIIPKAIFNYDRPEDIDFRICWSLKNLQPLEASKNQRKGAKIYKPFQPSLKMAM